MPYHQQSPAVRAALEAWDRYREDARILRIVERLQAAGRLPEASKDLLDRLPDSAQENVAPIIEPAEVSRAMTLTSIPVPVLATQVNYINSLSEERRAQFYEDLDASVSAFIEEHVHLSECERMVFGQESMLSPRAQIVRLLKKHGPIFLGNDLGWMRPDQPDPMSKETPISVSVFKHSGSGDYCEYRVLHLVRQEIPLG